MGGKIELGDIQLIIGDYYPLFGEEVSTYSATPYFLDKFPQNVALDWSGQTKLCFMIGGKANEGIWAQVIRPDKHRYPRQIIKYPTQSTDHKQIRCDVVIKQPYKNHHIGDWYLTIGYEGYGAGASSRRTVTN